MMRPGEQRDAFPSKNPRPEDAPTRTPIARFLNAAEAGYFAHELKLSRNIPVTVQAEEDFDALSGHWSTRFVLFVPTLWAERAALTLQELVQQSESEEYDYTSNLAAAALERDALHAANSKPFDPFTRDDEFAYPTTINWVPIVVTLAAGSLAIWGVKKFWDPVRPQAVAPAKAPRDVLWDMIRTPQGRKWIQQDATGRQIRVLEIHGNEAVLREDNDGDQFFEHTRRVQRP